MQFTFKCPHCGLEYDGLDYVYTPEMDGELEFMCDGCEKEFSVKYQIDIKFITSK